MIDTHTHLYFADSFPDGGGEAVERAFAAGVSHLVLPNVNADSVEPMIALHQRFPESTSVAIGLHPSDVNAGWRDELREIRYRMGDTPYVAWGEIGLDLHWEQDKLSLQMDAFGHQLDEAFAEGKPVIVHSRDALEPTLEMIAMMGERLPLLLFHSFTSSSEDARRLLEAAPDSIFGFNGVVTFKNAPDVRDAAAFVGLDRIVLETDSPYLAPVPWRGRTNESSFLPAVADVIATTLGVSREAVDEATTRNARTFFSL